MVTCSLVVQTALLLFIGTLLCSQLHQLLRNETSLEQLLESEELHSLNSKETPLANIKSFYGEKTSPLQILFPL
jgi:hypothetical protein